MTFAILVILSHHKKPSFQFVPFSMSAVFVAYKYYYTELFENGMNEIWNQSKRNEENSGEIRAFCEIKVITETLRCFLLVLHILPISYSFPPDKIKTSKAAGIQDRRRGKELNIMSELKHMLLEQ